MTWTTLSDQSDAFGYVLVNPYVESDYVVDGYTIDLRDYGIPDSTNTYSIQAKATPTWS